MITSNKNEQFSEIFIFYDLEAKPIEGAVVSYIIADLVTDVTVSSGIMLESTTNSGIYKLVDSINTAGEYICYARCDSSILNMEIKILPENIYDLIKSRRNYNQSYENVKRPIGTPNTSQILRGVPEDETDYIIHRIKEDFDSDWSNLTASGNAYPYYRGNIPYKVEGA